MKYAGIVLRNVKNPLSSVDYAQVFDALLAGGVVLEEIVFVPYDAPGRLSAALLRLAAECDGVFAVCARVLVPTVREAVQIASEETFSDECMLESDDCLYAVLPEGERGAALVREQLVPAIDKRRRRTYARVVLRAVSAPPESLREVLCRAEEIACGRLFLHASEQFGDTRIEVVYDQETPKMIADEVVRVLASGLKEYLYAMEDVSPAARLVEALKLHKLHVATAESFTAGRVGAEIVRIPGASAVFYEGVCAYDNRAKHERLGVNELTLMDKGAVSDETAYEMAAGLLKQGHCDLAIATTGIAGPSSDVGNKPIGLCYIAVGTAEKVRVFRFQLAGDRECVTQTAVNLALFLAYKEIG